MKLLNGKQYFEKPDVLRVTNCTLEKLLNNPFVKKQSSSDILFIQNSIKKFSSSLILSLKTERV